VRNGKNTLDPRKWKFPATKERPLENHSRGLVIIANKLAAKEFFSQP
jgi:hypothetical protein